METTKAVCTIDVQIYTDGLKGDYVAGCVYDGKLARALLDAFPEYFVAAVKPEVKHA